MTSNKYSLFMLFLSRFKSYLRHLYSRLAQLVEHLTVNQGVTGSSPVSGAQTELIVCWFRDQFCYKQYTLADTFCLFVFFGFVFVCTSFKKPTEETTPLVKAVKRCWRDSDITHLNHAFLNYIYIGRCYA